VRRYVLSMIAVILCLDCATGTRAAPPEHNPSRDLDDAALLSLLAEQLCPGKGTQGEDDDGSYVVCAGCPYVPDEGRFFKVNAVDGPYEVTRGEVASTLRLSFAAPGAGGVMRAVVELHSDLYESVCEGSYLFKQVDGRWTQVDMSKSVRIGDQCTVASFRGVPTLYCGDGGEEKEYPCADTGSVKRLQRFGDKIDDVFISASYPCEDLSCAEEPYVSCYVPGRDATRDVDGDGAEELVWRGAVTVFKRKPEPDGDEESEGDEALEGEARYEQVAAHEVAQVWTVVAGEGRQVPAASIKDPELRALAEAYERVEAQRASAAGVDE
jgi:hypothetical protein